MSEQPFILFIFFNDLKPTKHPNVPREQSWSKVDLNWDFWKKVDREKHAEYSLCVSGKIGKHTGEFNHPFSLDTEPFRRSHLMWNPAPLNLINKWREGR